jgi:hypothetical protein
MVIVIGKRYRERKKPIVLYMFLFSLSMSFAILMAAFSRVLRYTGLWEVQPGVFLEFLTFTVCFISIGNIFMLIFCLEVFTREGTKSKWAIAVIIIYSLASLGFIIYSIITGWDYIDLTTEIWGIAIGLSLFAYVPTMIAAIRLTVRVENRSDKISALSLAISPLSIMMVFVMFFLDRIFGGNFTVYYYIGWVWVIISMVFMYIGVIRPRWAYKEKRK